MQKKTSLKPGKNDGNYHQYENDEYRDDNDNDNDDGGGNIVH